MEFINEGEFKPMINKQIKMVANISDEITKISVEIPNFHNELIENMRSKYKELLKENKLDPDKHNPVVSYKECENKYIIKIGVGKEDNFYCFDD